MMSTVSLHKEVCPKCGKEQMVERYDSINDYHKELFPQIVDKTIFDYECEAYRERIHAPYPLLFHRMGVRDIQIGYKISPIRLTYSDVLTLAMKTVMDNSGLDSKDISERYDDEDEFVERVSNFLN